MIAKRLILSVLGLSLASGIIQAKPEDYLSPIYLVKDKAGKKLYIAEHTARQVAVFDVAGKKVSKRIPIQGRPNGLALSSDESLLYVTIEEPEGQVFIVDVKSGKVKDKIDCGHTPMSPVLSLDGNTLYICNRFNNSISIIDLVKKKELTRIPVTREPVASVLSLDGKLLFVANHLPTGRANVDYMTSTIDVIDTAAKKIVASIDLPNGAIDLRRLCLSPDGKFVYVPSILARFMVPTTQIERGWINTHAMNLIDVEKLALWHTILLDDVDQGAANPWGIMVTPDNKTICVAHSGTHEVSLIDREALHKKLAPIPTPPKPDSDDTQSTTTSQYNPANDLSFLTGIRRRIKLKGNSPRDLTVIGNELYVTEYITDSIGILKIDADQNPDVQSIALGPAKEMDIVRRGEKHFWDASLCFQQWQNCATCHPDARTDAVNWDLLNDGIGNPKSTKSLLNSHFTPPAMITGVRDKAETAVRSGIRYIQFAVPEEEKATAIDAYLSSLKPIPSPYLENGKMSREAIKGKKVFVAAGCASCHSGPYFTNLQNYNVGTGDGREKDTGFDTPALVECWRTAPYLYDGRAATMKDVFTEFNTKDNHGVTSKLSEKDLNAMVLYILSL